MHGPSTGNKNTDKIYNDSLDIKPGIWNSFKKINLDHYQSVGHMVSKKQEG